MSLVDVDGVPPMIAQGKLIEAIARTTVPAVDPGWSSIVFRLTRLSPVGNDSLLVTYPDREIRALAPRDVLTMAKQLRDVMYVEGIGTWFTFELRIDAPGSVTSRFNYDDEPVWDAPVPDGAYVSDQHSYPRDVEHQPAWLEDKLVAGWTRINELDPENRPEWVRRRLEAGTHELTPTGLVER